jgi:NADH-quinone oxidoreductase subunit N
VEAAFRRFPRTRIQLPLALISVVAALVVVIVTSGKRTITAGGSIAVDGPGLFLQGSILILGAVALLLIGERTLERGGSFVSQAAVTANTEADRTQAARGEGATEVFPLALFALGGMMLFCTANDLLTMFVALEVFSLPLYLLCALARHRRLLSQEAALKYFLLGAFASAFFLYGLALLYGYANSVDLPAILTAAQTSTRSDVLLYLGLALLVVGLLFKAGIAPFHSWTPDVYQGSPTAVTAFMASCTKVAAFGAILRVLYVGFSNTHWDWRPLMWAVAITTMAVGAIFGLTQTDVKRILAYSSIAHAGFILVGLIALTKDGVSSTLFYLVTYGFATVAAFGLVTLVRDPDGEATHLSQWSGLARKSPIVALVMTILLMSMAGIPLTAGFVGKFTVFRAAYHDSGPLVVIALIASAVAAFYYLRIVVLMYFAEPPENAPTVAIPSPTTTIALTLGTLVTIVLGVFPQPVLDLASHAARLRG